MKANRRRAGLLAMSLAVIFTICYARASTRHGGPRATAPYLNQPATKVESVWDKKAAAAYLDRRQSWWMEWPKAARDHDTFCVSCHTAVPYALARPALSKTLGDGNPSANERRLLENVAKRVRLWKEVAPFYSDADRGAYKTVESRGTESVLNALILASHDAQSGRLSEDTRTALANMWAEQQTTGSRKGAWLWLRFANEPWEADDSDFYGATLAAIAVGTAPEKYQATAEIQPSLQVLRGYLNRESAAQPAFNRIALLWASTKLSGLLSLKQQRAIIDEIFAKQQADGGWSLATLAGSWKRHDGTPQEMQSDGYATGLIVLALREAGIAREDGHYQAGLLWLTAHQNRAEGFWPGFSLNKNEKHHISPETARFMSDAATAYAVLALNAEQQN